MKENEQACHGEEGQIDEHYKVEIFYLLVWSEEEEISKKQESKVPKW